TPGTAGPSVSAWRRVPGPWLSLRWVSLASETTPALPHSRAMPRESCMGTMTVQVDVGPLTIADVVAVARDGAAVALTDGGVAAAGLTPVELKAKEGLALINGTDGMLGMLVLAITDLRMLLRTADIAAAMSVEAQMGTDRVFAAELQELRPQVGQGLSAANL